MIEHVISRLNGGRAARAEGLETEYKSLMAARAHGGLNPSCFVFTCILLRYVAPRETLCRDLSTQLEQLRETEGGKEGGREVKNHPAE